MAPAVWGESMDVDEVIRCAAANAPEKSFVQTAELLIGDTSGQMREVEVDFAAQRGKQGLLLNVRVRAPADLAGTVVLLRESAQGQDDMRIFLPSLRRTRRVSGSMAGAKLFGSDFSYQDLRQIYGSLGAGTAEYVQQAQWQGRPVHRIALYPAAEQESPYTRLIASIDRENCVLQSVEFFAADEQMLKRLDADVASVTKLGERHLAQIYVMRDLTEDSHTKLTLKNWIFDEEIARTAFTPVNFQNYRRPAP